MSDAHEAALGVSDFLATGIPVYAVVSATVERIASEVFDASAENARTSGQVAGAAASIISTLASGIS